MASSNISNIQLLRKKSSNRISAVQMNKANKSILSTTKYTINKLIVNDKDMTPLPISPYHYKSAKEKQITMYDINDLDNRSYGSSKIFQTESTIIRMNADVSTVNRRNTSQYFTTIMSQGVSDEEMLEGDNSSIAFSVDEVIEVEQRPLQEMPPFISLVLKETDTFFVLHINSSTVLKDSPEGEIVDTENKYYEYLTQGKGKNRKVVDAQVQTARILQKTRETEAPRIKLSDNTTFVSQWEMYDTLCEAYGEEKKAVKVKPQKKIVSDISDDIAVPKEDTDMLKLLMNDNYLEAYCVMQRILANNVFNTQQKRLRGLMDPSPFRENIEYKYTLNLLWTFANDDTKGRCVTGLCFNPKNRDLIAVGYGKFYYDDEATGLVLVWNIKNPVQPERQYYFDSPVTSVDFSIQNPNELAVGFYNGDVIVLDITSREIRTMGHTDKHATGLYEPIWQVYWYTDHDYHKGVEFLAATCQDGRIFKLCLNSQNLNMSYNQMMIINNAEGKLKGIETLRKCTAKNIPLSRNSSALVYTPHPVDPNLYFIGTGEGVIHKCSKNYFHQHVDLFLAHESPIYSVEFSPFCNKLFLTCGDDWQIRLWAEGISEPLFEIKKRMMGVQGVVWSPSHSTIIASISGTEIFLWDLQRKTYDSQSVTVSPTKSRNTLIKFSADGRCLYVADIDGNVHVFSLEDMPFPAFFQENLLTQSIKRALITRPDLLNLIDRLNGLSFDNKEYLKYKSK